MAKSLMKKLNYSWRLLATAISFCTFGIGGVLLWWIVFPLLALYPGDRLTKVARAQRTVHYSFYLFIGLMHRLGVMTYHIEGLEKLNRPGQLIVANHPTLIDIVFLISRIQQASCIVKSSLYHNASMRGPILNAGYISNEDSGSMISECALWLKTGGQMIIFPEGTRTIPGQAYRFQRGAAAIALQADTILTPVTLTCHPHTLAKNQAWYDIPERRFHLHMHVGDDIALNQFKEVQPRSIAVRWLTRYLQDYFTQRRSEHDRIRN